MDKLTNAVNAVLTPVKAVTGQAKTLSTDLVKASVPIGGLGILTDVFGFTNFELLDKIIAAAAKLGIGGTGLLVVVGVVIAVKLGIFNLLPTQPKKQD